MGNIDFFINISENLIFLFLITKPALVLQQEKATRFVILVLTLIPFTVLLKVLWPFLLIVCINQISLQIVLDRFEASMTTNKVRRITELLK